MTTRVWRVWVFEQSTTGVWSTQSFSPRLAAGVFRHCPTLGGGGTSPAPDEGGDETAVDGRVGRAAVGELASLVQPVQAMPIAIVASKAAARTTVSMSGSPCFKQDDPGNARLQPGATPHLPLGVRCGHPELPLSGSYASARLPTLSDMVLLHQVSDVRLPGASVGCGLLGTALGSNVDEDSTQERAWVEAPGWGGPSLWFVRVPGPRRIVSISTCGPLDHTLMRSGGSSLWVPLCSATTVT